MAKDDYHVLVGKILIFLYKKLKGKSDAGMEYLTPNTKDFPIDEDYFEYLIRNLSDEGLIAGVSQTKVWGRKTIVKLTDQTEITPKGIEYLLGNSFMRKVLNFIPEAAGIAASFLK